MRYHFRVIGVAAGPALALVIAGRELAGKGDFLTYDGRIRLRAGLGVEPQLADLLDRHGAAGGDDRAALDRAGGGDIVLARRLKGEGDLAFFVGRLALQGFERALFPEADLHAGQGVAVAVLQDEVKGHAFGDGLLGQVEGGIFVGEIGRVLDEGTQPGGRLSSGSSR